MGEASWFANHEVVDGNSHCHAASAEGDTISCEYRFTSANGMPPREDRFDFIFTSVADDMLRIKQQRYGQVFTNADALSEYLLIPVLTGRPAVNGSAGGWRVAVRYAEPDVLAVAVPWALTRSKDRLSLLKLVEGDLQQAEW